ncbi:purine-nucleoside phosphorylase [Gracilibacillus halotolerans]|uniref:Purine nucleoside phosphorylase n=1 Tax=Gracilibacillus halotolerans TaxID=74386 RepID=A0A841RKJ1_9BACI|nr:purine-nucleoside phosphorylase [Gracilibacillus halotolerans]MBB6511715.1 purine-nucleoside phosphorylase [Gracilibacillus halotolerans]
MTSIKIKNAAEFLMNEWNDTPDIALILGSGLGVIADEIESPIAIRYEDIPEFPVSTVEGHQGKLVFGKLNNKKVVAMQGRFHFYEGYTMQEVTFPVRVMQYIGIKNLIVTNAAGGVNEEFSPGDLMIITDHINQMGDNPLIGRNDSALGVRFPDMSNAYSTNLVTHALRCAEQLNLKVKQGVYAANTGPAYETPAEVRMLRTLGADAVGMSTVPEVIVANHGGMDVLGISCISNMAAGILDEPLSHTEVIETTEKVKVDFIQLIKKIVETYPL